MSEEVGPLLPTVSLWPGAEAEPAAAVHGIAVAVVMEVDWTAMTDMIQVMTGLTEETVMVKKVPRQVVETEHPTPTAEHQGLPDPLVWEVMHPRETIPWQEVAVEAITVAVAEVITVELVEEVPHISVVCRMQQQPLVPKAVMDRSSFHGKPEISIHFWQIKKYSDICILIIIPL
jgi:hypothetical protein